MTRMKKSLLIFTLVASLTLALPTAVSAVVVAPGIEQLTDDDITLTVNGQTVYINGAQGQSLEVISLTGRKVMTVKIDSASQKIELNIPKGCYILKVGKVVRKVTIH